MHGGYLGKREQLPPLGTEIVLWRTRERRLVAVAQQGREFILISAAEQHRHLKQTFKAQALCRRRIPPLGERCKQAIETLRYVLKQCIHFALPPRCDGSL